MTTPSATDASSATRAASIGMLTIDCADAHAMAVFWASMLGGSIEHDADGSAMVKAGDLTLGFGEIPDFVAPIWPDRGRKQFHLDLAVADLDDAATRAVELGATRAEPQPEESSGRWVVLLDPAGHPFCLAFWS